MSPTRNTEHSEHGEQPPAARTVTGYLEAFYTGDFDAARGLVSEDFAFSGPFLESNGADQFFAGAEGLRRIVRGHRLVRQWAEGADISTLYEVEIETALGKGAVLMSEWDTVREGRLAAARVVFDTAAFRKLVPQAGAAS